MRIGLVRLIVALAVRNLGRNSRRTGLTLLAVAAGLWSAVTLAGLARGVSEGMARDAIKGFTGHIQIHAPGYIDDPSRERTMPFPDPTLLATLEKESVKNWAARVRVPAIVASEREAAGITLLGIDAESEKRLTFLDEGLVRGEFFKGDDGDGIVLGKKLLEILQSDLGKRVVVMTQGNDQKISDRGFRVVGVFDSLLESREKTFAFISRKKAQDLTQIGANISEVSLVTDRVASSDALSGRLGDALRGFDVTHWSKLEPLVVSIRKIQTGFLRLWSIVVVIAISFGLVNTIFMSIFERVREFGLMQALGLQPRLVISLVCLESALLLVIGIMIGNITAFLTVHYLSSGIDISKFARGAEVAGIASVIYPVILVPDLIVANTMIFLIGLGASIYPSFKAAGHSPLEAIGKI